MSNIFAVKLEFKEKGKYYSRIVCLHAMGLKLDFKMRLVVIQGRIQKFLQGGLLKIYVFANVFIRFSVLI